MGMNVSLQTQQIATLMAAQDHAENMQHYYVGVDKYVADEVDRQSNAICQRRNSILKPDNFQILRYRPKALNFAGSTLERPQLLALREKLLQGAQDSLMRGSVIEAGKVANLAAADIVGATTSRLVDGADASVSADAGDGEAPSSKL